MIFWHCIHSFVRFDACFSAFWNLTGKANKTDLIWLLLPAIGLEGARAPVTPVWIRPCLEPRPKTQLLVSRQHLCSFKTLSNWWQCLTDWVSSALVPCRPRSRYCTDTSLLSHWRTRTLNSPARCRNLWSADAVTNHLFGGISQHHWLLGFPGCRRWSLVIPLYELSRLTPDLDTNTTTQHNIHRVRKKGNQ